MIKVNLLVAVLAFTPLIATATVNTLDLETEYADGGKKVCIYSGSNRVETFIKEGSGSCPSKKTFH